MLTPFPAAIEAGLAPQLKARMSRPATTKWTTHPQHSTPSFKLRSAHACMVRDASAVAQPTGAGPSRMGNCRMSVPNAQAPNNTGTQHESQHAAIELLQDILGQVRRMDTTRPLVTTGCRVRSGRLTRTSRGVNEHLCNESGARLDSQAGDKMY